MSSLPHRQFVIDTSQSTPPVRDQLSIYRFPVREVESRVPSVLLPISPHEIEMAATRRGELGQFNPVLSRSPQPVNENYPGLSSRRYPHRENSLEVTPRYLQDALENRINDRSGRNNAGETGISSPSDVSSLSPSEVEMLGRPPSNGRDLSSQDGMVQDAITPLLEDQRLSTVPTIFDVATRTPENRTATGTEPSYEVPGSHSTSTRPDGHLASQSGRLLSAPILSQTAGAAVGTEVISGNRTLEISSYGSEDTAPRKRHYEGCMLCDPLPSPTSSVSSIVPDFNPRSNSSSGPPPSGPLPELLRPSGYLPSSGISTPSNMNLIKSYLEGEVAPLDASPIPGSQSAILDPNSPDYFSYRRQEPQPYAVPDQRGSLSTLMEADEDSHQASHTGRRASQDAVRMRSISSDQHRPYTATTTGTASHTANLSQSSLIGGDPTSSPGNAALPRLHALRAIGVNPFKRSSLNITEDDETRVQTKRTPWRGLFGREGASLKGTTEVKTENIELQAISVEASGAGHVPRPPGNQHIGSPRRPDERYPDDQDPERIDGDGVYETIDLGNPPPSAAPRRPWWKESLVPLTTRVKGLKMQLSGKWVKWILYLIGFIAVVLMVALPIILVAFPSIAQRAVNNAEVDLASLSITGAEEESLTLAMELKINPSEPMNVFLGGENLRLTTGGYNQSDYVPTQRMRRNHIVGHYSNEENGILGYLKLAEKESRGNDAAAGVVLKGNNNGRFVIGDVRSWGRILEQLVYRENDVEVQLHGKVQVKTGGLKADCQLKKGIKIPGIGGLSIAMTEYDILKTSQENFTAFFSLGSTSKIAIDFGTANFELLYGQTVIGKATVPEFKIQNGTSNMTALGSLSQDIIRNNPKLLGRFLSSLFLKENQNSTSVLSLRGVSASAGGNEIEWLKPAIQRLQIPLPLVIGESPGVLVKDFDLGFSLELSASLTPRANEGFASSKIKLPIPSNNLNPIIEAFGHWIEFHAPDGTVFAHLHLPVYPAVVAFDKETIKFYSAGIRVRDEEVWSNFFLKSLFREDKFDVPVTGNLTFKMNTGIGNASVENVKMLGATWKLEGYDGFTNGGRNRVQLTPREIVAAENGSLIMKVNAEILGTASLPIKLGPLAFRVFYNSTTDSIGQLEFRSFSLKSGTNTLEGELAIDSAKDQFGNFMTSYFAGGGIRLLLDAPNAPGLPAVSSALRGLNLSSTINSPGHSGFLRDAEFVMAKDTRKGSITQRLTVGIMNPLNIPMAVVDIKLSTRVKGKSALVAEASSSAFSETWLEPGNNTTVHLAIEDGHTTAQLTELLSNGPKEMELDGIIGVSIGSIGTDIHFSFDRVVGLTTITSD